MTTPAPLEPIATMLDRSLSIRHVYGDPVTHGDRTVIPVARVMHAFGAGGGEGRRSRASIASTGAENQGGGGGGGGAVRMVPVGALEIGPNGTRFVPIHPVPPLFGAAALGFVIGWLFSRLRRHG